MSGDLDTTPEVDAVARARLPAIERWFASGSSGWHLVAIGVVLVALSFAVRPADVWTADEGAVRAQVELLDNGTWSALRPFASIDPEEVLTPIHGASIEGDRYFPYTKQPLLPVILTPLRTLGAGGALIAWSLLGTLGVAAAAGAITRRFDDRLANTAMWIAALFTPALFYGYTVLAHTVAAAACGAVAFVAVSHRARANPWWLAAAVCAGVAGALRAEAVVYVVALAIAIVAVGGRKSLATSMGLALALVAGTGAGAVATAVWDSALGGPTPEEGEAILDAFRLFSGAFSSMILVDFGSPSVLMAVIAMTGGAGLLAVAVVREPDNTRSHWLFAGLSVVGSIALLAMAPAQIGGLLAACPILVCGLLIVPRTLRRMPDARIVLLASALFVVGVIVTQERGGGGTQWGGRYFLVMVPALLPIAIVSIGSVVRRAQVVALPLVVALSIASMVLAVDAVWVLNTGRANSALMAGRLAALAGEVAPEPDRAGTVMSTHTQIGRHAWRYLDDVDFFLVPEPSFERYLDRFVVAEDPPFGFFGAFDERADAFAVHDLVGVEYLQFPYFIVDSAGD